MDQTLFIGRTQPARHLDSGAEHFPFCKLFSFRNQIIERPAFDQFHNQIVLVVVVSEGKDLHHMGMIDRGGNPGLMLQLVRVLRSEVFTQKL